MKATGISDKGMSRIAKSVKGQDIDKSNYAQSEVGYLNSDELIRVQLQDDSGGSTKWMNLDQEVYDAIGTLLIQGVSARKGQEEEVYSAAKIYELSDLVQDTISNEDFIAELFGIILANIDNKITEREFITIANGLGLDTGEKSARKATMDLEIFEMADMLKEIMGADDLIDSLLKAMSTEEARANLDFIAQMHEISDDTEEY